MRYLGPGLQNGVGIYAFQPRISTAASASSLTPAIANFDAYDLTALAADLTINNPTGTPYDFQRLTIRIKDNGTSRVIVWGSNYRRLSDKMLPTETTPGKVIEAEFRYHAGAGLWLLVDLATSNTLLTNISLVNTGFYKFTGGSGPFTCTLSTFFTGSTALQENDVLLVGYAIAGKSPDPPTTSTLTSSGFTNETGIISAIDDTNVAGAVYSKRMSSSPDSVISFGSTSSTFNPLIVVVRAFRGVNTSSAMDVTPTTSSGSNSWYCDPPANSPSGNDGSISVVFGFSGSTTGDAAYASSDLDSFSKDFSSGQSSVYEVNAAVGQKLVSGTFNPSAFTGAADNSSNAWIAAHLILRSS